MYIHIYIYIYIYILYRPGLLSSTYGRFLARECPRRASCGRGLPVSLREAVVRMIYWNYYLLIYIYIYIYIYICILLL